MRSLKPSQVTKTQTQDQIPHWNKRIFAGLEIIHNLISMFNSKAETVKNIHPVLVSDAEVEISAEFKQRYWLIA